MAGLRFSEEMRGRVAFGEADCERGGATGMELTFRVTIEIDDVDRLAAAPGRDARAHGHVRCEALGGRFPVENGVFNLFAAGEGGSDRRMLYRLPFVDGTGHPLTLTGVKWLHRSGPARLWPETTTLYARVVRDDGELVASGILRIAPLGFLRQLATFRAEPVVLARFDRLFLGEMWRLYAPRSVW